MENVIAFLNDKRKFSRVSILAQVICFLLLFVQAYISTVYRVCYGDAAFALFKLCSTKDFFIPHHRYIAYWFEYLPWLGIQLNLSFKAIAILYSSSYTFNCLVIWLIYLYLTKESLWSWLFVICPVLGLFEGYNHLVLEQIGYVIALFYIMLMSYAIERRNSYMQRASVVFICIWVGGMHPNAWIVLMVGLFYLFYYYSSSRVVVVCHMSFILITILTLKCFLFSFNQYENNRIGSVMSSLERLKHLDNSGYNLYFKMVFSPNILLEVFYLGIIVVNIYYAKWKELIAILLIYCINYYFICFIFEQWETGGYMEYYAESIFINLLLGLYFSLRHIKFQWMVLAYFLFCFHFCLDGIYSHQRKYREREKYVALLCEPFVKNNISKGFISKDNIRYEKLFHDWALSYESLNSSKWRGEELCTIYAGDTLAVLSGLSDDIIYSTVSKDAISNFQTNYYSSLRPAPYRELFNPQQFIQ